MGSFGGGNLIYGDGNQRRSRPSCNVICTQTALHVHGNSCTVLIENTIENYLLPAHSG